MVNSVDFDWTAAVEAVLSGSTLFSQYRISSVIRQCFFPFQNNPNNLDTSYKTDLDLWDCLGTVKLLL